MVAGFEIHMTLESEAETTELGRRIAKGLRPGDAVLLSGALGSGKTTLAERLSDGLGYEYYYAGGIFRRMAEKSLAANETGTLFGSYEGKGDLLRGRRSSPGRRLEPVVQGPGHYDLAL